MMKRYILYFFVLTGILFAETELKKSDKELFIDKYFEKDSYENYKKESKDYRKNFSKDVDLKDISNKNKDVEVNLQKNPYENRAKVIAEETRKEVNTKEYKQKIQNYKDYIFNDKDLNFDEKMGNYKQEIKKKDTVNYKNNYLRNDERIIIAISSSIPESTIKNYFKELENVNSDVLFVLNGFIGNNPKKIMPTIKYVNELLNKDNGNEKDKFNFRIDVNPKLFAKYNIEKVPAIIYVENYNPFLEIQGNGLNENNDENVFISYGDSNISYVLEKINKDAKSENLNKFLTNLNKGFYNE